MLPNFSIARPTTLEEALKCLADDSARIHGGGTDLIGCLRDGVFDTARVVSLSRIPELRGISKSKEGWLRIGAMTPIAEIAAHEEIAESYTALSDAAKVVASPQLRNQGTLAGNLCQKPRCWYYRGEFHCLRKGGDMCYAYEGENQFHCIFGGDMCYIVHPSDTAPALAAFSAFCRVAGPRSSRKVAVDSLHVAPSEDPQRETVLAADEIITEIVLMPAPKGLLSSYRKVRARASWDFALAGIALALSFDGDRVAAARIFLSGAAPVPWRAIHAERAIAGKRLDAATIAAAAQAVTFGAEPLAKNGFKVPMFQGLITDQLEEMATKV